MQAKLLLKEKIDRQIAKGINPRAVRGLIVGIPNVGKSTLINRLAGRSIALTGDRPGVTKGQQWIKVGKEMELLDTPGILWPKFESKCRLSSCRNRCNQRGNFECRGYRLFGISYLMRYYWDALEERYGLQEFSKDADDSDSVIAIMEQVGRIRGCIVSGGRIDLEKASRAFLRELRAGKMGRFSMEAPY